jgi:hypothetical protein
MSLTATELLRGWVEWKCPSHGFLVGTVPSVSVTCGCGKRAFAEREGLRLKSRDLKALQIG